VEERAYSRKLESNWNNVIDEGEGIRQNVSRLINDHPED